MVIFVIPAKAVRAPRKAPLRPCEFLCVLCDKLLTAKVAKGYAECAKKKTIPKMLTHGVFRSSLMLNGITWKIEENEFMLISYEDIFKCVHCTGTNAAACLIG